MSTILDLALEPFSDIISLLDIPEILKMWLCGDKSLQWRLSEGKAVRKVIVWLHRSLNAPWPPVLRHFHGLTHFTASNSKYRIKTEPLSRYILSLSRNLQYLDLRFPLAISTFDTLVSANVDLFPCLTTLKLASTEEDVQFDATVPRTVTALTLGDAFCPVDSISLAELPSGLISLKCAVKSFHTGLLFPNALENIDLHLPAYLPIFQHLPLSCKSLAIDYKRSDAAYLTEADWTSISQLQLISLRLRLARPISMEEAQLLPKTLEFLALRSEWYSQEAWCLSIFPLLPQNLKEIQHMWPSPLSAAVAKVLPRNLESCPVDIYPEATEFLPPKIANIELKAFSNVSFVRALPTFLRHLTTPSLTTSIAALLPNTLVYLKLAAKRDVLNEETIKLLPRCLRELYYNPASSQTFDHIQSLEALPRSLTTLVLSPDSSRDNTSIIVRHPVPSQSSRFLPPSLTKLDLGCLDFSQSDIAEWINGLPRMIESLALYLSTVPKEAFSAFASNTVIRTLEVISIETPEDGWAPYLKSLPPKLNRLLLGLGSGLDSPNSNITNESLKYVPTSISSIEIPKSPLLNKDGISHLPDLDSLVINSQIPKWFYYGPWSF